MSHECVTRRRCGTHRARVSARRVGTFSRASNINCTVRANIARVIVIVGVTFLTIDAYANVVVVVVVFVVTK
jgi:hypothetical protein